MHCALRATEPEPSFRVRGLAGSRCNRGAQAAHFGRASRSRRYGQLPTVQRSVATVAPVSDEEDNAVARPASVELAVEIPPARVVMRNYFSTYLLWASKNFSSKAAAIENNHTGESRFDMEHRAYVISAVMSATAFVEAFVNELFQDAADNHGITGDGYIAPLTPRTRELMREWWMASGQGFERVLDKIQLLLVSAAREKLDRGAQPFQDAALLVALRNALVHFRPESVAADVDHRFTKALRGRFAGNALMVGSGNAWWPDHALGAGCARWAFKSARAIADRVSTEVAIMPNYQRHGSTWSVEK